MGQQTLQRIIYLFKGRSLTTKVMVQCTDCSILPDHCSALTGPDCRTALQPLQLLHASRQSITPTLLESSIFTILWLFILGLSPQ